MTVRAFATLHPSLQWSSIWWWGEVARASGTLHSLLMGSGNAPIRCHPTSCKPFPCSALHPHHARTSLVLCNCSDSFLPRNVTCPVLPLLSQSLPRRQWCYKRLPLPVGPKAPAEMPFPLWKLGSCVGFISLPSQNIWNYCSLSKQESW